MKFFGPGASLVPLWIRQCNEAHSIATGFLKLLDIFFYARFKMYLHGLKPNAQQYNNFSNTLIL